MFLQQRQQRLHKLQEYFRKKRENENKVPRRRGRPKKHYSVEIMREYHRQLANLKREKETEEEREARLLQIKEYNRMRRKKENLEQREKRLYNMQEYFRKKRELENEEQRQRRLQRTKEYNASYIQKKKEKREERLQKLKEYNRKRKVTKSAANGKVEQPEPWPEQQERKMTNQTATQSTPRHSYGTRFSTKGNKTVPSPPPSPKCVPEKKRKSRIQIPAAAKSFVSEAESENFPRIPEKMARKKLIPKIVFTSASNILFSQLLVKVMKGPQRLNHRCQYSSPFGTNAKTKRDQCTALSRCIDMTKRSDDSQNCILSNVIRRKFCNLK